MSEGKGAGEMLAEAAAAALAEVPELNGCYPGPPLQAALPYATVEAGLETDWGHKSGAGREVRLTVTLRDAGQRPERLRRLAARAEAALGEVGGAIGGWRIVTFAYLRGRLLPDGNGRWASVLDYRARMLSE